MKKILLFLFLWILLITFSNPPVWAGQIDVLINKLVEKGILNESEAKEILGEIQKEAEKQKAEIKEVAKEVAKKEAEEKVVKLPGWVEKMELKGDLRLRYEHNDTDFMTERDRGRFRWRLAAETMVVDKVKVGFGLASGGDDPRSTNQSLGDTFSSKGIRIDLAYAQYTPHKWISLMGGKFKNPLYRPADLLWDSDIRPEGAAAKFNLQLSPNLDLFFTPGFFVLDEVSTTTRDPIMYVFQPGLKWKITKDIHFKFAGAAYGFSNVKGSTLDHSADSNTLDGGVLKFDYDSVGLGSELGFDHLAIVPYLAFFGEYIKNPDPDGDNEGFLAGFMFGHRKITRLAQWQFKYNYRRLERDAWLDVFPDSDFFGGGTNAKGHEGIFKFGLAKYVTLGADYYRSESIGQNPDPVQDLLQIDLVLKW